DDGRRPWLRDYCAAKGVGYITRPHNRGAKAGNINHALGVTTAPFVMVLDADFVPKREFLMRTMGFFEDPKIGIVQVPHAFFNHDPLQSNLSLRRELPDDQRFFFEAIMPGRDGWDGAFCCGSNSVTRRALFEAIGGGLPEGSITEDMLLTLAGLRQGYITRYLNEPLAHGLAPESVTAFFIQRQRWAQGAMQILHLKEGPLGPGLRFVHRLLFLPTSWISQSLLAVASVTLPALMLLTGIPGMVNVSAADVVLHVLPMVVAILGGIATLAPGRYYWPAAMVLSVFQSIRLLPVVLQTLVRPRELTFKVTPKGNAAGTGRETLVFAAANLLIAANLLGLLINVVPDWRVLDHGIHLAPIATWAAFNLLVLVLVAMMCLQKPVRRAEERFPLWDMAVVTPRAGGPSFTTVRGDISLSGLGIDTPESAPTFAVGDAVVVRLPGVGQVPAHVARAGARLGLAFDFTSDVQRDALIVELFNSPGIVRMEQRPSAFSVARELLRRVIDADMRAFPMPAAAAAPPEPKLPPRTRVVPARRHRRAVDAA
ncbi:MAG: glycosyltransferase, partial [Alphaproteobacteria bacterium]|nr:glycosyltransferase [Alphaproteobacteria bacterium]